jgi:predicted nucleic-acid-binding Zn-ribbon protein
MEENVEKKPELQCLRCDGTMQFKGSEYIQLGKIGLLGGNWGQLMAGTLVVDIHECSACGKIELYQHNAPGSKAVADDEIPAEAAATTKCKKCGEEYLASIKMCPGCILIKYGPL